MDYKSYLPAGINSDFQGDLVKILQKFFNPCDLLFNNIVYFDTYENFDESYYCESIDFSVEKFFRFIDDFALIVEADNDHDIVLIFDNVYFCHEAFGDSYVMIKK